jgi:hypothetical protein
MSIKRIVASFAVVAAGIAIVAPQASVLAHNGVTHNTAESGTTIMVMKHLCNSSIKNKADFERIQKGLDPVAALAATVLACPTTALPGDEAVAGSVASPRAEYDFTLKGAGYSQLSMANDGMFMQHKLCESDLNLDANGDGMISTDVCLDISHYEVSGIQSTNGNISITETDAPDGFKFGALKFTPSVIDGNNDAKSLVGINRGLGRIKLNVSGDTDNSLMLHIYNFQK